MADVLEVEDLRTHFFTEGGVVNAVEGVSFFVREKEKFGLVGESGCGKTVTALSIMRAIRHPGRIVNGKIMFRGENLLEKSDKEMRDIRGREIAYITQDPLTSLDPVLTIATQLDETQITHLGLSSVEARERSVQFLEKVGISMPAKRINSYQHQFSGGMRQRIVISIAISCNPKLLIADEPTTNLDVTIQAQILELIREMNVRMNTSLILITHHLGLIAEMTDRVAVMYAGEIVELADTRSIFYDMRHPYTIGLLKCLPRAKFRGTRLSTIEGTLPDPKNLPIGCKFHPRCGMALEKCARQRPTMTSVEKGHYVACHLFAY